ncbi:MAG: multiheme c-type cytochrome [Planctomycetota bacterium]
MRWARIATAALVLVGLAYLIAPGNRSGPRTPLPGTAASLQFQNSESCAECHVEVYEEWNSSMHAQAWHDPLVRAPAMSDDFKRKDCIPCHAPRPVFEHGIGQGARVVPRNVNMHEGVDCLACHRMRNGVASTRSGLRAPCRPLHAPELGDVGLCAPCHDQHKTISEEWALTEEAARGIGCNECHMPLVMRSALGGLPARKGRSHRFPGAHDEELMKSAVVLSHQVAAGESGRELVVRLTNTGAAHHVPTDARHRALDLVVTLYDPMGRAQGPVGERSPGQEGGTYRWRFRNPYRTESGMADTRIPARAEVLHRVPLAASIRRATIEVVFKLTPYIPDSEGLLVAHAEVDIPP